MIDLNERLKSSVARLTDTAMMTTQYPSWLCSEMEKAAELHVECIAALSAEPDAVGGGDVRAQFEAWAKSEGYECDPAEPGMYYQPEDNRTWKAWQAALAARQPVGVEPVGYWFTDDPAKFAMPGSGFHPGAKPPVDAINVVPVYPRAPAAVPVEFDRARETPRRQSAVELLLEMGYVWHNDRWETPAPAAVPVDGSRDSQRLDFLDRMNATLNARHGTNYGWRLILSPQIVRLMAGTHAGGYVGDIDLNDSHGGNAKLSSCRAAIDSAMLATHPQPAAANRGDA